MTIDEPIAPLKASIEPSGFLVRAVQVALGVYLLPVVLIVVAVGAVGWLGLALVRLAIRSSRSLIPAPHVRLAAQAIPVVDWTGTGRRRTRV